MTTFISYRHNPALFQTMFLRYMGELSAFHSQKNSDPIRTYEDYYLSDASLSKMFIVNNGNIVGFIILQYVDESYGIVYPKWYIVEFYISPEYRRQGLGLETVKYFCTTRSNHFFIYILERNAIAKHFWNKVASELHLEKIQGGEYEEITCEPETEKVCFSALEKHNP